MVRAAGPEAALDAKERLGLTLRTAIRESG